MKVFHNVHKELALSSLVLGSECLDSQDEETQGETHLLSMLLERSKVAQGIA